jgi:hypothetical protein
MEARAILAVTMSHMDLSSVQQERIRAVECVRNLDAPSLKGTIVLVGRLQPRVISNFPHIAWSGR